MVTLWILSEVIIALAPTRTNIGLCTHTMAQLADGLCGETPPRQHHTTTVPTALAKITEAVDQIKSLTRRFIAKDAIGMLRSRRLEP